MRNIVILLAALFLFACKTTKVSTQIERDVQTEEKRDVVEKVDSTAAVAVNEVVETQNDIVENKVITEVVKELSKPDSYGQQYTTRITERVITQDKKDNTRTHNARDSSSNIREQSELTDKSDLKSDSSENTEIKEKTKVRTPGVLNWAIILLVIGALVFVYFILRRYKLL